MNLMQGTPLLFLALILLIAAILDLRFHKIPNWLTYSTIAGAIAYYSSTGGTEGFLFSLQGVGLGIAVPLIPYLMGGMGAGDAKLMGSVGGVLGWKGALVAFLFTAIVGGIYALVLLAFHGGVKETAKRYGFMLQTFFLTNQFIYLPAPREEKNPRLCYGLAIALGTFISVYSGRFADIFFIR